MGYVLSRLSGKAAQHTESCSPYGSSVTNPYKSAGEILEDLKNIYEDPDKSRNYRQAYIDLIQGIKRFSDFFIEFRRLSTFLGYGESQCMDDIRDKITECLQAALSSQMVQSVFLSVMKDYLIHLNNEQCAAKALKEKKKASTAPFKERTFKKVIFETPSFSSYSARAPTPPHNPSSNWKAMDPQHQTDEQAGNCFICHRPGHTAKDCSQCVPTPFQCDGSVSELHVDHENSSSDSENE